MHNKTRIIFTNELYRTNHVYEHTNNNISYFSPTYLLTYLFSLSSPLSLFSVSLLPTSDKKLGKSVLTWYIYRKYGIPGKTTRKIHQNDIQILTTTIILTNMFTLCWHIKREMGTYINSSLNKYFKYQYLPKIGIENKSIDIYQLHYFNFVLLSCINCFLRSRCFTISKDSSFARKISM